jgi:hypothetical protein
MKQSSLHYFKVLPKRRCGRPLNNPVPLPMFAVLPKKTKATKEVRATYTEDSGEQDGGTEKDVEVEIVEVYEVDELMRLMMRLLIQRRRGHISIGALWCIVRP